MVKVSKKDGSGSNSSFTLRIEGCPEQIHKGNNNKKTNIGFCLSPSYSNNSYDLPFLEAFLDIGIDYLPEKRVYHTSSFNDYIFGTNRTAYLRELLNEKDFGFNSKSLDSELNTYEEKLVTILCPICGRVVFKGARICPHCGNPCL